MNKNNPNSMDDKDWIEVHGFKNYEIHKHLGIRRKGSSFPLKGRAWFGYPKVTLMHDGKKHERRIHKLVGEHFVPNPNNLPIVNHDDSDRSNHSYDNLSWVSESGNQLHRWESYRNGIKKKKYKKEYDTSKARNMIARDLKKEATTISGKIIKELRRKKAMAKRGITSTDIKRRMLEEEYKQHGMGPIRRAINARLPFNGVLF